MITAERRGAEILWITVDAPQARNALDDRDMRALGDAWQQLREDETLRVGVLTGAGDRAFCVGSNLKTFVPRLQSGELSPRENEDAYMKGPPGPLFTPLIAAVNGDCLGGGLELLTCCDIRLSVPTARFGLPECRWGLFPGGGGTVRLPRQVGHVHAMDMLLTGRMLDADEAVAIGLVNRLVSPEDLVAETMRTAEAIAANGPLAVRRIKQAALRQADLSLAEAYALESEVGDSVFLSEQAKEGLAAFTQRRAPVYPPAGTAPAQS